MNKSYKFEIGDKVRVRKDLPHDRLTDYEADLMSDLSDRTITGAKYDATMKIFEQRLPMVVTSRENEYCGPTYECRSGKTKPPFMFSDQDLEPA